MSAEQHKTIPTPILRYRAGAGLSVDRLRGKGSHLHLVKPPEETRDKLRDARLVTLSKQAEMITPEAPRYDEVYQRGMALLESGGSLVIRDTEDEVILVADVVQRRSVRLSGVQIEQLTEGFGGSVRFLLFADLERIEIFSCVDAQKLHSFETSEIIHFYDATAEAPYAYYLTSLLEAWLGDLLYQWKSPSAPKKVEMSESGLLAILGGSSVERL